MNPSSLDSKTLAEIIEMVRQDPHGIGSVVRSRLFGTSMSRREGPPPPCPRKDKLTAVQVAIFDNWPSGHKQKGQPQRYGCALEVWTKPKDRIKVTSKRPNQCFKSSMVLHDQTSLTSFLKQLMKPRVHPISEGGLDFIRRMVEVLGKDGRAGLINTRIRADDEQYERGTYYHDFQAILIRMPRDRHVSEATLILGPSASETVTLPPFDDRDAAGNRHGGNVILQSRLDLCGFSVTWATNRDEE